MSWRDVLSAVVGVCPGVGTAYGIATAVSGRDWIAGEHLEWWERGLNLLPVGGKISGTVGAEAVEAAGRAAKAAGMLDKAEELRRTATSAREFEKAAKAVDNAYDWGTLGSEIHKGDRQNAGSHPLFSSEVKDVLKSLPGSAKEATAPPSGPMSLPPLHQPKVAPGAIQRDTAPRGLNECMPDDGNDAPSVIGPMSTPEDIATAAAIPANGEGQYPPAGDELSLTSSWSGDVGDESTLHQNIGQTQYLPDRDELPLNENDPNSGSMVSAVTAPGDEQPGLTESSTCDSSGELEPGATDEQGAPTQSELESFLSKPTRIKSRKM